ncbi:S-adenosyl-L-methionine-dependent methyltransferase [Marasmius fiardii PR-910]|nr:S-adenosyl-L-methionine-dependent methyltransferase [Marasmius fiardii PR-910]
MTALTSKTSFEAWTNAEYYMNSFLLPHEDDALEMAMKRTIDGGLPAEIAVSHLQGKFLNLLVRTTRSKRILEVGTLGGFSTIWLARALPKDGHLVTLELQPTYAKVAEENLAYAGVGDKCKVIVGPAHDSMKQMSSDEPFDFVFIDADKQSSLEYYTEAKRLTKQGGIIIVDNVFRYGYIADEEYSDPKVEGVRRLLVALKDDKDVESSAIGTRERQAMMKGEKGRENWRRCQPEQSILLWVYRRNYYNGNHDLGKQKLLEGSDETNKKLGWWAKQFKKRTFRFGKSKGWNWREFVRIIAI